MILVIDYAMHQGALMKTKKKAKKKKIKNMFIAYHTLCKAIRNTNHKRASKTNISSQTGP